jgi:thiosulfate dehydrogenase
LKTLRTNWFPVVIFIAVALAVLHEVNDVQPTPTGMTDTRDTTAHTWHPPRLAALGTDSSAALILYGRELIAHTARYFGPHGTIAHIANGMNCQNCHLDAGLMPYGNCFSAVASVYPVFRPRSGITESITFRINDCFQRSLNGKTIDSLGKEMRAMVAYITWLGKDVPKGSRPAGAGLQDLPFPERAADTVKGKIIYGLQCSRCHGTNGEGQPRFDNLEYSYPPLWGADSYNTGAGLYRISRLAAYAKDNMPFGIATHENPQLSNTEAWDVAAFINSRQRPVKKFAQDWPDIAKKSIDYPFGPYTDGFSEQQHKYGPYAPIKKARELASQKK